MLSTNSFAGLAIFTHIFVSAGAADAAARNSVVQIDANRFEVIADAGGSSGWAFWCAAGYYVSRTQRQPWRTEIAIARGRARSQSAGGRESVIFTTNAAALGIATTPTRQINALEVGQAMDAQQAHSYCLRGGAGSSR